MDLNLEINKDFEENSPYQKGIMSEMYQRPDKSQSLEPQELADLINNNSLIQKYLPKQTDIDKILIIIQRKVLKGTHLPVTIKEIQTGHFNFPYFKDIYLYLAQNKLPSSKSAIHKVKAQVERYILLDSLLFKLVTIPEKETALLAIPEIMSEMYQRPDKSQSLEPQELADLINNNNLIQKYLPKQTDIDKILIIIQRKVLKGTHLPVTIKEIQTGHFNFPYFKDIYLYLAQNKLPSSKSAIHKVKAQVERYILLDSLLFKLVTIPEKETALLAIPEICADNIITLYHSSLFVGHQGIIKT